MNNGKIVITHKARNIPFTYGINNLIEKTIIAYQVSQAINLSYPPAVEIFKYCIQSGDIAMNI
jgi:hypothetical protein